MRPLAAILLLLVGSAASAGQSRDAILIFSHTTGYRHDSIPAGIGALTEIARCRGLAAVASEDPSVFSANSLRRFRAIVLLSTTTDPNDPNSEWFVGDRRTALQQFVARGGGVLAIHAAADSHYNWPWYGKLIGGRFARHPPGTPRGKLSIVDRSHPASGGLPPAVDRVDEWYYFDDVDPTSTLLATLEPGSIGERDINPNPVAWTREVDGGRVFYTAMGHTKESYSEPFIRRHLANGMDWVVAQNGARSPNGSECR
ncbi:MAG: ThuA domain-containing protein [Pseudomonadota bacterium]|nr:ThuA domain-containing protein [Pseudomonadota bacterium]